MVPPMIRFAGRDVATQPGDTVLAALQRQAIHPTSGGALCAAGDCPNCVATIDGVSYVRTCQTPATNELYVEPHPVGVAPPLPLETVATRDGVAARHLDTDVVVVGAGESGTVAANRARADGSEVVVFDAIDGHEVVGVYAGPMVLVRTTAGMLEVRCREVVVATGAAEILPVCPGSDLEGILTPLAVDRFAAAGISLGHVLTVGTHIDPDDQSAVSGTLIRFEGDRRIEAVVTETNGEQTRHPCDTAVVALGVTPRDGLLRMGHGLAVRAVGAAAEPPDLPVCPTAGVVCPCNTITVEDLDTAWERGFREVELMKRATLAGTGTCQGLACTPYVQAFMVDRGADLQPPFTARPVSRQLTVGEASAGQHHPVVPRTALDVEHRRLGATMDRIGGWWRPWTYGDTDAEIEAVRNRVSLGDVGTLGKMLAAGPDAEAALQRLYPTDVSTIRDGRCRYVLMLNERGYVLDDGMICREPDGDRFYLTFTSGGASVAEMWARDLTADLDVRWMNVTMSLGAINVTGPHATELMHRAGLDQGLDFLSHTQADVAGVSCRVFRLSFTGEVSYELHHPADRSVELWQELMNLGDDLGIAPHGLDALQRLRLEKGHIIVGQDSDYDSTPRRLGHSWTVNLDKGDFIGRHAVVRTDRIPLDKELVGLEVDGPAPPEGAVLWGDDYAGYVTSSAWSGSLGKSVMLAWLYLVGGRLPEQVTVDGRTARRVATPFYDPEGQRARA
jgi:glycine cleavage system aminomethyltransferase T